MKLTALRKVPVVSLALLCVFINSNLFSQDFSSLQKIKNFASANQQKLGFAPGDVSTLSITHEYIDDATGIHHIYATQKINGLTINNTNLSLHTYGDKDVDASQLISLKDYNIKPVSVAISSANAISRLMQAVNYSGNRKFDVKQAAQGTEQITIYKRNALPLWDIPTRLVYYNNERLKTLQPAWEVQMMDGDRKNYWLAYIDAATGKVLEKRDLILHCDFGGPETDANLNNVAHAHTFVEANKAQKFERERETLVIPSNQYRVFDLPLESPADSVQQPAAQTLSSRAGDPLASPDGWHRVNGGAIPYNYSRGNNVWAFQDPSPGPLGGIPDPGTVRSARPNNGPLGTAPLIEPFVFDYKYNVTREPEDSTGGGTGSNNYYAAIVNLFYWNNLMHDVFYYMGFTEAAGNFEESHLFSTGAKTGGVPGDEVLAQAQDAGGTNNANFLALNDGVNGQMQMYLWTASFPDSLVQITSSSTGTPPPGTKYVAIQGSFPTKDTANTNLYTHPVLNTQYVLVQKNPLSTVGSSTEGCSTGQQSIALPPGNNVSGKIVVIDRGSCSFVEKVYGAQLGGARGVIIVNNVPGPPIAMGGTDAPGNLITIPAVMVSQADGNVIKSQLLASATIIGNLKRDNPPAPKRDGDVDNGVMSHEYMHGISNRLTGGPNDVSSLGGAEQGGEGWSDFAGLYMTLRTNDLTAPTSGHPNGVLPVRSIGNYVTYQPYNGRGIREYPYSTDMSVNPATFAYVKRPDYSETHSVGFVWCSMLYELLQGFIDKYGMNDNIYEGANPTASKNPPSTAKGNNIATRLVVEAMKLQPTSPTFVQERDAILKADTLLYNGQDACIIWAAFAKRGLGASAVSGSNALGDEFEAFDVPLTCDPTQKRVRIKKSAPVKANNGSTVTYNITVTNLYPVALNGLVVRDTLAQPLAFTSASDNPTVSGKNIEWTINLAANQSKTITLTTQLNSAVSSVQVFSDDQETSSANWTVQNNGGLDTWTYKTDATQAYSGTHYWFAPDTDLGGSNTSLKTTNPISIPANAELAFIHKYATESGYDGGVLEISTDNVNWTYLPPSKFVRGGYNGIIPTANNPSIGTSDLSAFTGASDGYQVSIAKLDDYANRSIYIRFRMTSDATGGSVTNGGWWLDDVYVLTNRTEVTNSATAYGNAASSSIYRTEGENASSGSVSSFILGGSALASNLGNLSAAANRQAINLVWNAYNDINTAVFEIERKVNGESAFRKIGEVSPITNGAQANSYKFTDVNIGANNAFQYRIKQVSKTGEFTYTNIAMVTLDGKTFTANLYPNPARDAVNLTIQNPGGGKVNITLFDGLGKKVATFNGATATSQVIPLPVQNLNAGTYWVEVNTSDDNHTTLRLVISK
jgi:extracellular elastinolytic metalloproteinase